MESNFICLVRCEPYHDIEKVINGINTINNDKINKYIALPHAKLSNASDWSRPKGIHIGALSMNNVCPGSFTESMASQMLIDEGVHFVFLGDRIRRHFLNETNQIICQKVKNSLNNGLKVVLAIPDSKDHQEKEWIIQQLQECVEELSEEHASNLTLVYQPTSSNYLENIDQTVQVCREAVIELWGDEVSQKIKILLSISKYTSNFLNYFNSHQIDGVCISGSMIELEPSVETLVIEAPVIKEEIVPTPIPVENKIEHAPVSKEIKSLDKDNLLFLINCQGYHDLDKTVEEITLLRSLQITKTPFSCYLSLPPNTLKNFSPKKRPSGLFVGSSEMNRVTPGHFTESIASKILTDNGADFVFLGTEKHRNVLDETDQEIRDKIYKALELGIKPFLGTNNLDCLEGFTKDQVVKISLVYSLNGELDINAIASTIRQQLQENWGEMIAKQIPLIFALPKYSQNILEICAHSEVDGVCLTAGSILEELTHHLKKLPSVEQKKPFISKQKPVLEKVKEHVEKVIKEEEPIEEDIIKDEEDFLEAPKKEITVSGGPIKAVTEQEMESWTEESLDSNSGSIPVVISEDIERQEIIEEESEEPDFEKSASEDAIPRVATMGQVKEHLQETVNTCSDRLAEKYFESTYIPSDHDLESPEIKRNRIKNDFKTMFDTFKEKNKKGWDLLTEEMEQMQAPQREKVIQSVNPPLDRLKEIANFNQMSDEVNSEEQKAWFQILGLSEASMKALYEAAKSLFEKERYTDAANAFYTLVSMNKNDYKGWFGFALSKKIENLETQTAIDAFTFAKELDPTAPEPLIHLAECHSMLGDDVEAGKLLVAAKELMAERENSEELISWSKQVEDKLAA